MNKILQIYRLLDRRFKFQSLLLVFLMALGAALDIVGLAAAIPFLAVFAKPESIHSNTYLQQIYEFLSAPTYQVFSYYLAFIAVALVLISMAYRIFLNYRLQLYVQEVAVALSNTLLGEFLSKNYVYFLDKNSSEMAHLVVHDVTNVIAHVLHPALVICSNILILCAFIFGLVYVDPVAAAFTASFFLMLYACIYFGVTPALKRFSAIANSQNSLRYKVVLEALGGIKQIKTKGFESIYLKRFNVPSSLYRAAESKLQLLASAPRYFVEAAAFAGVLGLAVYFLYSRNGLGEVLPLLGFYVLAGSRILPTAQQIFQAIAQVRYGLIAANKILNVLSIPILHKPVKQNFADIDIQPPLNFRFIKLSEISFTYPHNNSPALNGINLDILANSTIGIVGPSGSGKTTLGDILLGLFNPSSGSIYLDGKPFNFYQNREWRTLVGYVPQDIYLVDGTIAQNIAFGMELDEIDNCLVMECAKAASIHDYISTLPLGYESQVGERGVRLSGGQRQRIAIARALYSKPKILIFDEATSALDSVTEQDINDAIEKLSHSITIIVIAHRIQTVRNADQIIFLKAGNLYLKGTYEELCISSPEFRNLAGIEKFKVPS